MSRRHDFAAVWPAALLLSALSSLPGPALARLTDSAVESDQPPATPPDPGDAAVVQPPASQASTPGPAAALPPAPAPPSPTPRDEAPLAGYTNGAAFLRSANNNFVLFFNGRLNVDAFFYLNRGDEPQSVVPDGPADPRPKNTIFIRRARAEIGGVVVKHWDWYLAGEFATAPAGAQYATFTDVFINANYTPWANVQAGQFDAPFTMENRTSDKYIDFMERSLAVRGLGVPTNKELGVMIWGLAPSGFLYYSAGAFNGDGNDVKNLDGHFDFMGRAYFAPLAFLRDAQATRWLRDIWIGGSAWYGQRTNVAYDAPGFTTQGGVSLMPSTFGQGVPLHLGDNGDLFKWGVELNAPIGPFGLRFELVGIQREGMAIYNKAPTDNTRTPVANLNRTGTAFYIQAWYWILGDYTMLPTPGQEIPTRWKGYKADSGPWKLGLYLSAKYERLSLHLEEAAEQMPIKDPMQSLILGDLSVDTAEAALNLWLTKHLRLSANYIMNYLDSKMRLQQNSASFFNGTPQHEFLFRAAIGL